MQARNLDLQIPLTREQWDEIGRTAARLGPEGGFSWTDDEPEQVAVFLRDQDAVGIWDRYVSGEDTYGTPRREVARFRFNGGRPFAELEPPPATRPPAVTEAESAAMQAGLERWVRDGWQTLMRESGIHYERGHLPQS